MGDLINQPAQLPAVDDVTEEMHIVAHNAQEMQPARVVRAGFLTRP